MHCRHEPQVEKRAGGQTDTITRFQLVDAFTGLLDDSGYLVPEDDRIRREWKCALLDHQVAVAYSQAWTQGALHQVRGLVAYVLQFSKTSAVPQGRQPS